MPVVLIAGITSGIGSVLASHFYQRSWAVYGTSRRPEAALKDAAQEVATCDFSMAASIDGACEMLTKAMPPWDLLVVTPATMLPIGRFAEVDVDEWSASIEVNLVGQLRFVHRMIPHANTAPGRTPLCLFFAGGGTNSAPIAFSAYTLSKVALIKAAELLDAEHDEISFAILGPGWIRTSIHDQTLQAVATPPAIREETQRRLDSDDFIEMHRVVEAVDWMTEQSKSIVGGRNFSVSDDAFGDPGFNAFLLEDPNRLKLRRRGNGEYLRHEC